MRRISRSSPCSERQSSACGWIPIRRSSLTECWVGLVFISPAWPDVRHQREVDEHAALRPEVGVELADRLEERQRLDVADGPADLGDHEIDRLRLGDDQDPVLDLVGDVRDHLDGRAEVVAAPLAPDHRVVDAARREVGGARGVLVGEALVVAEVEVGLGAVLGDEHLAVLERAHRPRVDVDVGVELLQLDAETAGNEQTTERGGGDALPEGRDDTACHEEKSGVAWLRLGQLTLPSESSRWSGGTRSMAEIERNSPYSERRRRRRFEVRRPRGPEQLPRVAVGGLIAVAAAQHPDDLADQLVALDPLHAVAVAWPPSTLFSIRKWACGHRGDLRQVGDAENLALLAEGAQPLPHRPARCCRRPRRRSRRRRRWRRRPARPAPPARASAARARRRRLRRAAGMTGMPGLVATRKRDPLLAERAEAVRMGLEGDLELGPAHRQLVELVRDPLLEPPG